MNKYPEYLFHYTSIESLCLILRSKSLKFSRLDKVDDLDEANTKNFPYAKSFVFVSCWTSEGNESLPLWKMYSSDMKGVRIRLPVNMFKGRYLPDCEVASYPIISVDQSIYVKRNNLNYSCQLIGPHQITYDPEALNNNDCFIENEDGTVEVDLLHLGSSKRMAWSFESEWRFKIIGMPFEGKWKKQDFDQFKDIPTCESLFVNLDPSALSEIIVQLGPRATLAESEIVELLLKNYAPGAKLCDSSINIRM